MVKKIIAAGQWSLTVVLLCSCLLADAQIEIAAKGGLSLPNLEGNNEQSKGYTSRAAFCGGAAVSVGLSHRLSLQTELNFSPQGGQRKGMQPLASNNINGIVLPQGTILYANFKNNTILNYLEVPLLLKITFGRKLKYFVSAGPCISFILNAKSKTSGNSSIYLDKDGTMPLSVNEVPLPAIPFDNTSNIRESIRTINTGITGGFGFSYPLGPGRILLEGRALVGLSNIQANPQQDGKNQTGSLSVLAGYAFKIK